MSIAPVPEGFVAPFESWGLNEEKYLLSLISVLFVGISQLISPPPLFKIHKPTKKIAVKTFFNSDVKRKLT
jgi:hypothetical protein